MLKDERGYATLNEFFAWIFKNTKQDARFHVMMARSDSFFQRWVTQYVDTAYFMNFVIRHLSKEEAKKFWEEMVIINHHNDDFQPLTFEDAYEVCGGCMHHVSQTYRVHFVTKGIAQPYAMSFLSLRRGKFIKLLSQPNLQWKQNDIFTMIDLMVKNGCVV